MPLRSVEARGLIQFASSSASRIIGYSPESLVGVALSALSHPEDASRVAAFIEMTAQLPGISPLAEWRMRRPDGLNVEVEAIASNLLADESVGGLVLNARDIGERKALLDQLAHQAFHDPLTGLANRALFAERLREAVSPDRASDPRGATAVVFIDLDNFKSVNDTFGHQAGDEVLRATAARIRDCLRPSDTAARLGGDEFAVLLPDLPDTSRAMAVAQPATPPPTTTTPTPSAVCTPRMLTPAVRHERGNVSCWGTGWALARCSRDIIRPIAASSRGGAPLSDACRRRSGWWVRGRRRPGRTGSDLCHRRTADREVFAARPRDWEPTGLP